MKNKLKGMKGITLIALVITIIVLLILAGVSIATLTGENGILTQANNAKNETKEASAKEEVELALADLKAQYYISNPSGTLFDYLTANLSGYETAGGGQISCTESGDITYTKGNVKYTMTLSEDGSITTDEKEEALEIGTAEELKAFAEEVNNGNSYKGKTIVLVNDIDLSTVCSSTKGDWTPIGTETNPFKGTFDGKGKTISKLYISSPEGHQGLFGYSQGNIKNIQSDFGVIIQKAPPSLTTYGGTILGYNDGGNVENCSVLNLNLDSFQSFGGIVGYNNGNISLCSLNSVTSFKVEISNSGGIVGKNEGEITKCFVAKNISISGGSGGNNYAGIAGNNSGEISNCYNLANVSSSTRKCSRNCWL